MAVTEGSGDRPAGPRRVREAGVLLLAALLATAVLWAVRGDRLPLRADPSVYELELAVPLVTPKAALVLYDEGEVLFADTRPTEAGDVTIPGAFPLRQDSFDDDLLAMFDFVDRHTPLLLFGDGSLVTSAALAERLLDRGYTDVRLLAGGVRAWERAGGDVRPVRPEERP